ncbi:N-acetylmuramoyl-L-alanine amidase [Vulgatibacter sp.]|uniref:N-acetylmuramoyl-L-alanine amidase n=1 Tax=Vulgatibacter sp. TaxID=1971226 RepID=UPI003566DBB2
MLKKNLPAWLIVHESVSAWGTAADINRWHLERGFQAIGYHYVIGSAYPSAASFRLKQPVPDHDGALLLGRDLDGDRDVDEEIGAHCPGYNSNSLGVCLIGEGGNYSEKQLATLYAFLASKVRQHGIPVERIRGHCETDNGRRQGKKCPSLPMDQVRAAVRARLELEDEARATLPAGATR